MLFLLFHLGPDRYALSAGAIVEVLPLVTLKQLPLAPAGVAGVLSYRATPVPVIDVSALSLGRPASRLLGTRIVVVNHPDAQGKRRLLGLILERATDTVRRDASEFVEAGVDNPSAPFLGPVAADAQGFVQWIQVDKLLPAPLMATLFDSAAQVALSAAA